MGDIVSFRTAACWPDRLSNGYTTHRVIAVRAGPEYLTQGDANPEPDCWMPFSAIEDVLVDVRKDAYPENAVLREKVNAAWEVHSQVAEAYQAYTGNDREREERLWNAYERAKERVECWRRVAILSEEPGHIPNNWCDEEGV